MSNFAEIATPLLPLLSNLPDAEPPRVTSTTTFPVGAGNFEDLLDPRPFDPAGGDIDRTVPVSVPVAEADVEAGRSVLPEIGLDVLAFYKSFRFLDRPPFRGQWGIFLLDQGIATVASEFQATALGMPRWEAERLAQQTLIEHERYHFWIDAWTLSEELTPHPRMRFKRYEYYLAHRAALALSKGDFEESLANHYAFRRLSRTRLSDGSGPARLLRRLFSSCPEPYSNFDLDPPSRLKMEGSLAGGLRQGVSGVAYMFLSVDRQVSGIGQVLANTLRLDTRSFPLNDPTACPIYNVNDVHFVSRVRPFQAPDRAEFRRFVEAYLDGSIVRHTDHEFFKIDNGETIKFPNPHVKTIKRHERNNILFKAGMRDPEYRREREATKVWKRGCPRPEPRPPLHG
ncbi:MAG: hypothetical protein P1U49_04795 [Minwuia sp.]|nr:hypothetical protein [Minwuia sp.]